MEKKTQKKSWWKAVSRNSLLFLILLSILGIVAALYIKCKPTEEEGLITGCQSDSSCEDDSMCYGRYGEPIPCHECSDGRYCDTVGEYCRCNTDDVNR